jgi:hypothetical protein
MKLFPSFAGRCVTEAMLEGADLRMGYGWVTYRLQIEFIMLFK